MKTISVVAFATIACLLVVPVKAKLIKSIKFGNGSLEGRIVGGTTAEQGLAPYQVSLHKDEIHACGGSIIDSDWIITAAHCVAGIEPKVISVLTGTQDLNQPGALYYVKRIHIHCNFNNPDMHNDLALLHLNSSIILNEKTQVVALPTTPLNDGNDVLLTGWGSEEAWGDSPQHLKKIELVFMAYKRCREALNYDPDLDVGHICTFTKSGEGACHGDSGGPLVSNGTLVGLVNWGHPCGIGYPDVYAGVYFYLDWIRIVMSGNAKCLRGQRQY